MGERDNRIDQLVRDSGMSFRSLARRVGISPRHLRYIRQGSDVHLTLAQKIADALGCTLDDVFPTK